MKKLRNVNLSREFLEHLAIRTDCPAPNSLFSQLWSLNAKKAARHIESFNCAIASGDLNFINYGKYLCLNECYRYQMARNFMVASTKAKGEMLKALLQELFITTKISRKSFSILWGNSPLKDLRVPVSPYFKFLRSVTDKFDPIYSLIPVMAREQLSYWIPLQVGALGYDNPYSGLVNYKYDVTSAYAIGNFLERHLHNYPRSLDVLTTQQLYSKTVDFEIQTILNHLPLQKKETNVS